MCLPLDQLDAKICSQRTESKSQPQIVQINPTVRWTPKYAVKELKANHNTEAYRA